MKKDILQFPMRINKYLAHKGYATRREADTLITKGIVTINDRVAVLGDKVLEDDIVFVKNRGKQTYTYVAYHKPKGVITHSPNTDEVDIQMSIKDFGLPQIFPLGRLDKASSGLILLSNDGRVTERLLSPDAGHEKEYNVTVEKKLEQTFKKNMEHGVDIEGYVTKPAIVKILGEKEFSITLTEGKKHQIRRMCAALGHTVQNLTRVRIMNIKLEDLKENEYRELQGNERATFLRELGLQD